MGSVMDEDEPLGRLRWTYFFDDASELLWLLRCNHVPAGQHADIQAMVA